MTIPPETKRRAVLAMCDILPEDAEPYPPHAQGLCEEMLDAALAVIFAEAWQPIGTAPKGRSHVVVLLSDGSMVWSGGWNAAQEPDDYEGWDLQMNPQSGEPTHWRHLPPPPKVAP